MAQELHSQDFKPAFDLGAVLAALRRDYSPLAARIRTLEHAVACECDGVTLRVHYASFQNGECSVGELARVIALYLVDFALTRAEIEAVLKQYEKLDSKEFQLQSFQLMHKATRLFKRAQIETNRNGEAGELLLFLLTDWALGAPQLVSKMALKTNREMPVHGADGVHVRFCPETQRLILYWGESKLYADVGQALTEAVKSIAEAMKPDKLAHELDLVQRNLPLAGLSFEAQEAILCYLNPFEEASNARANITTCLIGFNYDGFAALKGVPKASVPAAFEAALRQELPNLAADVAKKLKAAGIDGHTVELFFFPVPSVADFRDQFQDVIGWKTTAPAAKPKRKKRKKLDAAESEAA